MNLVPYTLTALSRQDIPDTPTDRNIVVGAIVTAVDASGATATMFDDAAGSNGSNAKQTGANGQVTVYVEAGEYTFSVNGREFKAVAADFRLRSALAAPDSAVLVGGVEAGDLALAKWRFITPRDIDTNGVVDATAIITAALAQSNYVALPDGDIKITGNLNVAGKVLLGNGKDKTRLICASPGGDNRFGGSFNNQAAVFANGVVGNTVKGASVIGLTIVCNGLLNATGSIGLKGVMFRKAHGCYAKDIRVIDSRSYAFWCADDVNDTDYASAVFEDCEETGSEIGFEAVNVTTCYFIRCKSEKPRISSAWPVFSMFHAYTLKDDALVVFDNCYGKGRAATVVDLLFKCRNIQFKGGYFEQVDNTNTAIFLTQANSDYDYIEFGGARFVSAGKGAVLTRGLLGGAGQKSLKMLGGSIVANSGVCVEIQGNNGLFEFVGTDIESNNGTSAGLCFVSSGSGNIVQFTGGSLKSTGGAGTVISQGVDLRASEQTIQEPSSASTPRVKQLVYGNSALQSDGTYSFFNAIFSSGADMSKIVVTAIINATGAANGQAAAAQATPISYMPLDNQVVRIYADIAAVGRNVRWQMVEYA